MSPSHDRYPEQLNEAQRRVLGQLGARAEERPTFPDGLAVGLRERLRGELDPVVGHLAPDDSIYVSKFTLTQVLGCEARYVYESAQPFNWSIPAARGTVVHRAIELSVHWRGEVVPALLVDEALASLAHSAGALVEFIDQLPEAERALLRSDVTNQTQSFLEGFPPLRLNPQWRPAVEVKGRWEGIGDGRIVLAGKVDMSLGSPTGDRSGRVFLDMKSGRRQASHRDDLRYYALIESLRYGTPPRMLASYYVEESRLVPEAVTQDLLWAAVERVIDGVTRVVELDPTQPDPATPDLRPSLACQWCPLRIATTNPCTTGQAFLDSSDEDELGQFHNSPG